MTQDELKLLVAEEASNEIKDGVVIGIGSGSTVKKLIPIIGEMVKNGLNLKAVATSDETEKLSKDNGIEILDYKSVEKIDLTLDGADEVDKFLNLLKGGGGAHVREKIVAKKSHQLIIMVDESKVVEYLGEKRMLPIELKKDLLQDITSKIEKLDKVVSTKLRMDNDSPFVTDNNNYILDVKIEPMKKQSELEKFDLELHSIDGVIDTGFFLEMADKVYVSSEKGIEILTS